MAKWFVVNRDSGLKVSPSHPYRDTDAARGFDSKGQAEAMAVVLGGAATRVTPGHEGEAKYGVEKDE